MIFRQNWHARGKGCQSGHPDVEGRPLLLLSVLYELRQQEIENKVSIISSGDLLDPLDSCLPDRCSVVGQKFVKDWENFWQELCISRLPTTELDDDLSKELEDSLSHSPLRVLCHRIEPLTQGYGQGVDTSHFEDFLQANDNVLTDIGVIVLGKVDQDRKELVDDVLLATDAGHLTECDSQSRFELDTRILEVVKQSWDDQFQKLLSTDSV